jgi:hypothetical protein
MGGVATKIAQKILVLQPARASKNPSIIPAGPPPTMVQVVWIFSAVVAFIVIRPQPALALSQPRAVEL